MATSFGRSILHIGHAADSGGGVACYRVSVFGITSGLLLDNGERAVVPGLVGGRSLLIAARLVCALPGSRLER
jgi:hypothetical protein